MLVPPENFGVVEPVIYRCSKLISENFSFIETLNLNSLIILDAEKVPRMLHKFLEQKNIELFNFGGLKVTNHNNRIDSVGSRKINYDEYENERKINQNDDNDSENNNIVQDNLEDRNDQWMLIEKNIIQKAFEILLDKRKHNVLLVDSTSTLIGILRKIQKWNFHSIINEYKIYTGNASKNNFNAEIFLELIQIELVPYEIEQVCKKNKQIRHESTTHCGVSEKNTEHVNDIFKIDEENDFEVNAEYCSKDDETNTIDDDEMDESVLSSSPQIPVNLLKLVEKRKQEVSRCNIGPPNNNIDISNEINEDENANNKNCCDCFNESSGKMFLDIVNEKSLSDEGLDIDTIFFSKNVKHTVLENENKYDLSDHFFEYQNNIKNGLIRQHKDDIDEIKKKYNYKYYMNLQKHRAKFEHSTTIKLKMPPDEMLPTWFKRGRDFWERKFNLLNNIN